jgi:hypothetical protein
MNRSGLMAVLPCLILFAVPLSAADLTQIDRRIAKEPAYKSKPKYCLLVLGPEAKTRVWLVQDGNILYVYRNGNGDLTEPGEKVAAESVGETYLGRRVLKRDLPLLATELTMLTVFGSSYVRDELLQKFQINIA